MHLKMANLSIERPKASWRSLINYHSLVKHLQAYCPMAEKKINRRLSTNQLMTKILFCRRVRQNMQNKWSLINQSQLIGDMQEVEIGVTQGLWPVTVIEGNLVKILSKSCPIALLL